MDCFSSIQLHLFLERECIWWFSDNFRHALGQFFKSEKCAYYAIGTELLSKFLERTKGKGKGNITVSFSNALVQKLQK